MHQFYFIVILKFSDFKPAIIYSLAYKLETWVTTYSSQFYYLIRNYIDVPLKDGRHTVPRPEARYTYPQGWVNPDTPEKYD